MFARVTTVQAPSDRVDEAARLIDEQVIPKVRQLEGFRGAYWLADHRTGRVIAVALWEDEAALRASAATLEQARTQSTQPFGATVQSVEEYEVIAHS